MKNKVTKVADKATIDFNLKNKCRILLSITKIKHCPLPTESGLRCSAPRYIPASVLHGRTITPPPPPVVLILNGTAVRQQRYPPAPALCRVLSLAVSSALCWNWTSVRSQREVAA